MSPKLEQAKAIIDGMDSGEQDELFDHLLERKRQGRKRSLKSLQGAWAGFFPTDMATIQAG